MSDSKETREEQIERRIDREVAGHVALAGRPGGAMIVAIKTMSELMEFAKIMATAGPAVGPAFRGLPGACLAITMQALKWNADPFAVSYQAYITRDKSGNERLSYMAQLIHSVVNTHAPLKERLKETYTGQGTGRACKITGWLIGEDEPFEYQSPTIANIAVKNSPLWTGDPDQQLHYYSTRAWARRHVPEIILGMYTPEELRGEIIDIEPSDVTTIPPRPTASEFASDGSGTAGKRPRSRAQAAREPEVEADVSKEAEKPSPAPKPPETPRETIIEPEIERPGASVREPDEPEKFLYAFGDIDGGTWEYESWEEAVQIFSEFLDNAKGNRKMLEATWENGEKLRGDLLAQGHKPAADLLDKFYRDLVAETAKKAAAESVPDFPPDDDTSVPFDPMDPKGWVQAAYAKLRDMERAKAPAAAFARFRERHAEILAGIGDYWKRSLDSKLDQAEKRALG